MKKTLRGLAGIVGALVLCLTLYLPSTASAGGPPKGIDPNNYGLCTIYNSLWDNNTGDGGISLRTAIYYANNPQEHSSCGEKITLNSDVNLMSPLVILRDNLEIDGKGFVLDVKNRPDKPFDVSADTDGLSGEGCAVLIRANNVKIRNLSISGDHGAGYADICFAGTNNKLEGVHASGGQYGMVFTENSFGNRILPNSKVSNISEFGIVDQSFGQANIVIMDNRQSQLDSKGYEEVDNDGIVDWKPDAYFSLEQMLEDAINFIADATTGSISYTISLAGQKGLLKSARTIMPLISYIDQKGTTGRYEVRGLFKNVATDQQGETSTVPQQDCSVSSGGVDRLAIFSISGSLIKYIATVGKSTRGVDVEDGTFKFYMDPKNNPEFAGLDSFILVPVGMNWELVGRASNYIRLADLSTDCLEGTGPSGNGSGSGDGGEGGLMGYTSVAQCNQDHAWTGSVVDADKDSDLDGIPDYIEMGVRKMLVSGDYEYVYDPEFNNPCSCDGKLSCWYLTDTDRDGIPDGPDSLDESGIAIDWEPFEDMDGTEPVDQRIFTAANADGDYQSAGAGDDVPDVRDVDSDNDGLNDGQEDRTRLFVRYAPAYFYKYDSLNLQYYPDSDGNRVKCDLSMWGDNTVNTGIYWGIFKASGTVSEDETIPSTYVDVPQEYNMFNNFELLEGQGFFIMACVNEGVIDNHNYNGIYDKGQGETNLHTPDTDEDCVCDHEGPGCAEIDYFTSIISGQNCKSSDHNGTPTMDNPLWLNDGCPQKAHPTSDCNPACLENEVLQYVKTVAPEWIVDSGGTPKMKDENSNTIPDLFEQTVDEVEPDTGVQYTRPNWQLILQSCSDIDKDGIPDCVERWDGKCSASSQIKYLDPYKDDTDGDGLMDGMEGGVSDVCPFTLPSGSQSDQFNGPSGNYSCNPRQVYTSGSVQEILSCFIDRDSDQLRDCEEDHDMNGLVGAPILSIEGIVHSESDPLKVDTDEDALDDFVEVNGWPYRTNPNAADSDGDGLLDIEEDHDGNMLIEITLQEGLGCNVGVNSDTDPRYADTDSDGLSDHVEITGSIMSPDNFLTLIEDPTIWGQGGIPHASSPVAKDSDGDGLTDDEEYNGTTITYYDSNPCMIDSDGDSKHDKDELPGCRLNPDENCIGSESGSTAMGVDSDSDGLSDGLEMMLGTDPQNPDTDGDGVWDGIEDANHNGIYEPSLGETNPGIDTNGDGIPDGYDTDADGLSDGFELRYGTDPTNSDTDSDCILDGIEDLNRDGQYNMGTETDARNSDTDGDGLPDGWVASSGLGEDLNCDGIRNQDADGRYLETDPRNPDSDLDGISDYDEMLYGGYFNLNNINRSTTGREGCSIVGTQTTAAPTGIFYLLGLALVAVRAMRKRKYSA